MFNFNVSFGRNHQLSRVERNSNGGFFYELQNGFNSLFNKKFTDAQKYDAINNNFAVLFVFDFIAKNYSQLKVHQWQNDKIKQKDILYSLAKSPNPQQSWTDFYYDYSFYYSIGNVYVYRQGDVIYCLNPFNIKLTDKQNKDFSRLTFSKYGEYSEKNIKKGKFEYFDNAGNKYNLDLENLHIVSDLSNSVSGSWFKANSKLDALYQIIKNIELTPQAKNINTEFTGKFLVSGHKEEGSQDIYTSPLTAIEQKDIEKKVRSNKQVTAVKNKININRFADNMVNLKFDESTIADIHLIGMMYGLSKDVIAIALEGSTYENQEKSLGRFVDYTLSPIAKQMTDKLEQIYEQEDLRATWEDMPFNQVFKAEKVANKKIELESLKIAMELGLSQKDIDNELKIIYGS